MAYICDACEQRNTFSEVAGTILKIAMVAGIGYLVFTHRAQIKEVAEATASKVKQKLSGPGKRKKKIK